MHSSIERRRSIDAGQEETMQDRKLSRRMVLSGFAAGAASVSMVWGIGRAQAQAAPAVLTNKKIRLRYGHSQPANHSTGQAASRFVKLVSDRTNGAVTISLFPNNQLGTDRELQMMIETDQLDFTHSNSATMGNFLPQIGVMDLPFIWRSPQHYFTVVDGPFHQEINKLLAAKTGHRYLNWWFDGTRNVYTGKRVVNELADLRGLKIRAPEAKVFIDTFTALGANPTPLPFPEIYTAIEAGVIDGFEGSNGIVDDSKLYEVAKHRAATGHIMVGFGMTTAGRRFDALPKDIREIIATAALEVQAFQRELQLGAEDTIVKRMISERGVANTQPDLAPFRQAVQPVHEAFHATHHTQALRDLILKAT
ncbi:putative Tripartite ATP-independent transporter solute receptor, DctP family [Hyphomicrobiales bacterium]|nr:putative Tripartite ATP-independent transporter solute receptor, DctP family [Hyphomicrobiales bacterium]